MQDIPSSFVDPRFTRRAFLALTAGLAAQWPLVAQTSDEKLPVTGVANPNLSTLVKPLALTPEEKADLVAFLKALTGKPIPFQLPKLPEK